MPKNQLTSLTNPNCIQLYAVYHTIQNTIKFGSQNVTQGNFMELLIRIIIISVCIYKYEYMVV